MCMCCWCHDGSKFTKRKNPKGTNSKFQNGNTVEFWNLEFNYLEFQQGVFPQPAAGRLWNLEFNYLEFLLTNFPNRLPCLPLFIQFIIFLLLLFGHGHVG